MTENWLSDSPLAAPRSNRVTANRMQLAVARICHDLVSPLGAVANGIELMLLSGQSATAELDLVDASSAAALARLRFFRIAFGLAEADKHLSAKELRATLGTISASGRVKIDWLYSSDAPAREVQAVFLAIQCLENALPYGGELSVDHRNGLWQIDVHAARVRIDPALWQPLMRGASPADAEVAASALQFMLLPDALQVLERQIKIDVTEQTITITF